MTTITVLGPGCKRCAALEAVTRDAVAQLGLDVTVTKVTDYAEMARLGVMSTPALAVDGQIAMAGSVPDVEKVKRILCAAA
jgi:small redox-active disulfide protein 2